MKTDGPLSVLLESGEFRFQPLILEGIDNQPVLQRNRPEMVAEETCLFHRRIATGAQYLEELHRYVRDAMDRRRPAPVVRFADGEYAYYSLSLQCNGLYRQAESKGAIRRSLPMHVRALRELAAEGRMAPLIFPGNCRPPAPSGGWFKRLFSKTDGGDGAQRFLRFLLDSGIDLPAEGYTPFYVVYAYLTSAGFAAAVDGRRVCLVNSEYQASACRDWFAARGSRPIISHVRIPASLVATRWLQMRAAVLAEVPSDAELCLVGAGIGSLPVCVDLARHCRLPAVDAGHVVNMLNDREDKSNGPRLYTSYHP